MLNYIILNMLVGYNTNISYKGTVYHVQTEDNGIKNPHIITLLYVKGAILASKKTSYADMIDDPDYKEKVRELMKEQHKIIIKELIAGTYLQKQAAPQADQKPLSGASAAPAPSATEKPAGPLSQPERQSIKSLDDILLDYILEEEEN